MNMTREAFAFLEACIIGLLFGAFYDMFRIIRIAFHNPKWLVFLEDVLYFSVITVVSFVFIIVANNGVLRGFLLLGELLGLILYFFTISIAIMKFAHVLIFAVNHVVRFLYRLTLKPIIKLFRCFIRWMRRLCTKNTAKVKIFISKRKLHLK